MPIEHRVHMINQKGSANSKFSIWLIIALIFATGLFAMLAQQVFADDKIIIASSVIPIDAAGDVIGDDMISFMHKQGHAMAFELGDLE